jgi:putative effector of murein hydrolase/putative effector of murein hydrolase LrgA (UPF0299 family)
VFVALLLLPTKVSERVADRHLEPGAALLSRWLPVFFVPSLIALPLADGLGSAVEIGKVGIVVAGGFLLTLWSTAASVVGIRRIVRKESASGGDQGPDATALARFIVGSNGQVSEDPVQAMSARAVEYAEKNRSRPVMFSRRLERRLAGLAVLSTVAAGAAAATIPLHSSSSSIRTATCAASLLISTLATFVGSSRLPLRITRKVHPLVFTTTSTWAVAALLARLGGPATTFRSVIKHCYRGKWSSPFAAGPVLLWMLGPAVVSLSLSMYRRRLLMRDNVVEVGTAVAVSTAGGLLGTALAVRLLNLANPFLKLSLLSRNITSPLAMAIAGILGADVSLAVTMVVVTGLLGANYGASLLDWWGIKDPVARGLGMGAAAHGLGTAALSSSPDEAAAVPFAVISMALCASASTVAVSVPAVRQVVLQIALGA